MVEPDPLLHFGTVDSDVAGRIDPDAHRAAFHAEDCNCDVVVDDDGFVYSASEN